jgi:PiT family inorganic phosphate transporter
LLFQFPSDDKIAAAKRWVPVLLAVMAAAFSCYLVMKGLSKVWRPGALTIVAVGVAIFVVALAVLRPWVARRAAGMENRNQSLRILFHVPLICSAALLSFAHGANDVANAVGPLAAIYHSAISGDVAAKVAIPLWVMLIGAAGISLGLFLFGPRLVRMVGAQITKMNPMRAFCVALSAAITVIVASALGLPVSSTHIAVGAVFGVGFFREYYTRRSERRRQYVASRLPLHIQPSEDETNGDTPARKLVRRSHFITIIAAWLVTVPAAALLAGLLYLALSAIAR